ncbi:MAG: divalent-cation tolerance protein CutA [Candidatus Thorarchaeota archaeon]
MIKILERVMTKYVIVLSTAPVNEAAKLARILVESKKCACVNVINGVTSLYHWKGVIQEDSENILIMKTEFKHKEELLEILKKHHSYEVPEFVTIPIEWGSTEYLDWITASTTK